jgi:outer membrane protein assembly factor BamB
MKRTTAQSELAPPQPSLRRLRSLIRNRGSLAIVRTSAPTLKACLMLTICGVLISVGMFVSASEPIPRSNQDDAAHPDDAAPSFQIQHGPMEVLSELLLRDRQSEIAISEAVGDREHRETVNLRSLQQIFAQPTDSLQLDRRTGSVTNTRQMAMGLLKLASRQEQTQWKVAHEEFARAALEHAASLEEFLALERQFPMTEAGLKAGLTAVTLLHLNGLTEYASARLLLLESGTKATILESEFLTLSAPVRKAIDRSLPRTTTEDASKVTHRELATTQVNLKGIADVPTIAAVWPKPTWNWTELIEDFPNAPQPATTNAMLPFVRSHEFNLGDFNNWRPVLTKGCLIHRTPMRIVAFDQSSGKELWTLNTNTVQFPPARASAMGRMNVPMSSEDQQRQAEGVLSIRDLQAFGMMSSDQSYLYFLDGIPLINLAFQRNGELEEIRFGDTVPQRKIGLPTRLVALKLNGAELPQVAWVAGSPAEYGSESGKRFEYRVQAKLESHKAADTSGVSETLSGSESHQKSPEPTPQSHQTAELSSSVPGAAASNRIGLDGARQNVTNIARSDSKQLPTLDQHSFLSPPIGFADQLFVMTEFNQQTYLSSLSKTKGRLLWQRPLSHTGRRDSSFGRTSTRGSCLMSRGVLVCVLHDGLAIGVRPADGQLLWATALTEPENSERAAGVFRGVMPALNISIEMSVTPVANSSLIVAMHPGSWHVVGIEPETGHIRWRVSRSAIGMTAIDGQLDQYIAGVTESKVVMIGENHCRALDLKTGEQLWTSEIAESCGRAEVSQDRCLIPQQLGQLLTVDLESGHVHRPRHRFLPDLADQPWGAIASSENRLFAVTPVSVTSFVRCDAALENDDLLVSLDEDEPILTRARLLLLNHQEEEAIAILQREVSKSPSYASSQDAGTQEDSTKADEETRKRRGVVDRTLAEVILQRWADLYVIAVAESRTLDGFAMSDSPSELEVRQDIPGTLETRQQLQEFGASDNALLLGELDLDSDQQLRAAVLSLLSRPDFDLQAEDLAELEEFKEWSQALPLTDDWTVRPDLLLSRFINSPRPLPDELEKAGMMTCRSLAVQSILFPKVFADEDRTEKLVRRLVELEEYAAAEAVLLVWKRSCPSDRAASLLASLQTHGVIRTATESDVGASSVKGFTTTAISGRKLRFDVTDSLETTSTGMLLNAADHVKYPRGTVIPERIPYDLLLVKTLDENYQLDFSARRDGAIVSSLPLTPRPNDFFQWFSPSLYRDAQPSLLPLVGRESIIMIDCTQPGKPTVLWNRANSVAGFDEQLNEYIEFGPLGAEFMVWHADGVLHCTHPLTGEDLWSRRMQLKGGEVYIQGMRRIFGDEEVIVVLNEDNTRFERYRTRDGQLLGIGVLKPGPDCDAITMGRFLTYCDSEGRICLFDGKTGRNRFAETDAVFRLRNVVPQTFYALSDNRVLTVTKENEVLVIDVVSGRIQCRLSVQPHLVGDEIFAYTAFEQNGRLYFGVEDELDMHRADSDDASDDLPQIRYGIMFCVDPVNGRLVWNQRLQNMKFIVPSGDPTDVLVALQDRSFRDQHEQYKGSLIHVTLISGVTGEQIIEESISSRFPSRVTHHAADGIIELRAKETQTQISIEVENLEPADVTKPTNDKSSEHASEKKAE